MKLKEKKMKMNMLQYSLLKMKKTQQKKKHWK